MAKNLSLTRMVRMISIRQALAKVDIRSPEQEVGWWLLLGATLYCLGKWADGWIWGLMDMYRTPWLDWGMVFLTEIFIYIFLAGFAALAVWQTWRTHGQEKHLLSAVFSVGVAGILVYILKAVFLLERPFVAMNLIPLVEATSFSFPSGHTAVAFALLIPLWRMSHWLGGVWLLFGLLIGGARVYELVHYPSDIGAGIFLGGVIGALFSHREMQKLLQIFWQDLEFRRQSFHLVFGFLVVFTHWVGVLRLRMIGVILVLGLLISLWTQYKKVSFLTRFLGLFDRPRDRNFPGRGAFYFLLAVFLCLLIFPLKIAYAAILILAVGDSLNHLLGNSELAKKVVWNQRKTWAGIGIGVVVGTVAAQFFVPLPLAFTASFIAILAETVPWRIGKFYIDDNLVVPLVAGVVIYGGMMF